MRYPARSAWSAMSPTAPGGRVAEEYLRHGAVVGGDGPGAEPPGTAGHQQRSLRRAVGRLLDDDAGEFVAGGDAELAEGLAEVVGDGVGADVHAGGNLVVVQSLGDQAGDGLLGVGQAVPSGDGPDGRRAPVTAADAELAQPPPDARLVAVGADLAVSRERVLQVADGLIPVALPAA